MMLTDNSKLRDEAWKGLQGKMTNAVVACIIYFFITGSLNGLLSFNRFLGLLATWVVVLPIGWAFEVLILEYRRNNLLDLSFLFSGFKQFSRIFGTKFLQSLYVSLWTLLLVVPGLIKSYSYAMTSYILHDEPELQYNAAIEKSMAMMEGHKMKLFLLDLSFLGWIFLAFLTFGIGFLWLTPYMCAARAGFYEDLKKN